jgi:predicted CopG family antitoxin
MKIVNIKSLSDIVNELIEKYQDLYPLVGIYIIKYEESNTSIKNVIEINLVFKLNLYDNLPLNYEKYPMYTSNNSSLDIIVKGHKSRNYDLDFSWLTSERLSILKDILACEILYEENNLLTNLKNEALEMQKNNVYPFGSFDMEYANLIEFNPPLKLTRKKENNE